MKKQILTFLYCIAACAAFGQMSNFVGIGARLQIDSTILGYKAVKIIAFIPGGAAEHSGLKVGDLIMKVDDKSAVKMPLDDVVKMILGEEGSKVKLEVKQTSATKTFTLVRKKIQASNMYYSSASTSAFCTAFTTLLNEAPYDFIHVVDTTTFVQKGEGFGGSRMHPCKVKVPGAARTEIRSSFGYTCNITIGEYSTEDQVNTAGEDFVKKITDCFPKFYVFSKSTKGNSFTIQMGQKLDQGYTGALIVIYPSENKETHLIELVCRIENGVPHIFYTSDDKPSGTELGVAINKIYDDILNKFENIKTTEHKSDDVFNASYWYEINVKVPGAYNYYVDAGSLMSIKADQCVANFYYGESLEEAEKAFSKLTEPVREAFGSEFVFTLEKPEELLEPVLPANPEKFVIFTRKKERGYESVGVCSLVLNKEADGKYRTFLSFYKTGL